MLDNQASLNNTIRNFTHQAYLFLQDCPSDDTNATISAPRKSPPEGAPPFGLRRVGRGFSHGGHNRGVEKSQVSVRVFRARIAGARGASAPFCARPCATRLPGCLAALSPSGLAWPLAAPIHREPAKRSSARPRPSRPAAPASAAARRNPSCSRARVAKILPPTRKSAFPKCEPSTASGRPRAMRRKSAPFTASTSLGCRLQRLGSLQVAGRR